MGKKAHKTDNMIIPENFFPVANPSEEQQRRGCISIVPSIEALDSGFHPVYALRQDLAEEWCAKNHRPFEGVEGETRSVFDLLNEKKESK